MISEKKTRPKSNFLAAEPFLDRPTEQKTPLHRLTSEPACDIIPRFGAAGLCVHNAVPRRAVCKSRHRAKFVVFGLVTGVLTERVAKKGTPPGSASSMKHWL
jgi:hypothetical protein